MATNTKITPAPELYHFNYSANSELTLSFRGFATPFSGVQLFDDKNKNGVKDDGERLAGMFVGSDGYWSLDVNIGQLTPESSFAFRSIENNSINVSDIISLNYTTPIPGTPTPTPTPSPVPVPVPVPSPTPTQLNLLSNVTAITEPGNLELTTLPLSVTYSLSQGTPNGFIQLTNLGTAIVGEDLQVESLNLNVISSDGVNQSAIIQLDAQGGASFSFTALQDNLLEGDESLVIKASDTANPGNSVTAQTVVVQDLTPPPVLQITRDQSDIFEPSAGQTDSGATVTQVTYTISGAANGLVNVSNKGSAKVLEDLSFTALSGLWSDGDSAQQTVNVQLNDQGQASFSLIALADNQIEGDENLLISVSDPLNPANNSAAPAVILHDTIPSQLKISADQTDIFEPGFVPTGSTQLTQVSYSITGGTPNALVTLDNTGSAKVGDDLSTLPVTFTWINPDLIQQAVNIRLNDQGAATFSLVALVDKLTEGDETLNFKVTDTLNPANNAVAQTVTVHDTPVAQLQITRDQSIIYESADTQSPGQVNYTITGGTPNATINLSNTGTAVIGTDASVIPTSLVWSQPNLNRQTATLTLDDKGSASFSLTALADQLIEGDENLIISVSDALNTSNSAAAQAVVIRDTPVLSFSAAKFNVAEGNGGNQLPNQAVLTVNLSAPATQAITVAYQTNAGTALGNGVDYDDTNGTLTFAPGETSKVINVPIVGDTIQESDEDFTVTLINPSNNALLGSQSSATVTITNDDFIPVLAFQATSVSVVEGTGNQPPNEAVLTVELSTPAAQEVTVNYNTTDGTAISTSPGNVTASLPIDYQATSGTLTFAPGETTKTINIPIVGDALIEANEDFLVTLTTPSNNVILDTANSATVTIVDDDFPTVSVKDPLVSVQEGNSGINPANQAVVTVSLSSTSAQPVTVNYATSNGSATAAAVGSLIGDYIAASGTLTFAPGETSKAISVSIIGDSVYEPQPDENFFITLTGVSTNAQLGTANSSTITIVDDDG